MGVFEHATTHLGSLRCAEVADERNEATTEQVGHALDPLVAVARDVVEDRAWDRPARDVDAWIRALDGGHHELRRLDRTKPDPTGGREDERALGEAAQLDALDQRVVEIGIPDRELLPELVRSRDSAK